MNENETPRGLAVGTDYAVVDLSPSDLIDADMAEIETRIENWNWGDVRPYTAGALLQVAGDVLKGTHFRNEDLAGFAENIVPEPIVEITLVEIARRADDFDMIVALSKYLSADEGQRLYNIIITLTRMQRHRANLSNGVAAV